MKKQKDQVKFYAPRIFIRHTGLVMRTFKSKYYVQLEGFQVDNKESTTGEVLSQKFYCKTEKEVIDAVNAIKQNVTGNEETVINLVEEFNCYNDTHLDLTDEEILSECSSSAM